MNFAAFGLILICCHAQAIDTNRYHDYSILNKSLFLNIPLRLEKIKTLLRNGNESLGIPVLDPFTAEQMPIKINEDMLNLDANLMNLIVEGLAAFDVKKADLNVSDFKSPELTLNLSWPLIIASTNYVMKAKADSFEIFGEGEIKLSAYDFYLATEICFTMNGSNIKNYYLKTKYMKTSISLREVDLKITGLFNNEELSEILSAVISDMIPELIDDNHDTITDNLNLFVTKKLDDFLSNYTVMEILKMLS